MPRANFWFSGSELEAGSQIAVPEDDTVHRLRQENAALRAQLRQAELVVASAADYAIVTLDPTGCITQWSVGAEAITGYSAAEVLGRSGEVLFTPEDHAEGRFALELCLALEQGRAINERWHQRRDGSRFWASGVMTAMTDAEHQPLGFLNVLMDRTELRRAQEGRELLMGEMNHRLKNTLTMVQSVAAQTARHSGGIEEFRGAFASRLQVLARSHDALIRGDWTDAPLRVIMDAALEPYRGTPDRIALDGVAVMLEAPLVVTTSLVLHELAMNAAKYGGLSTPAGQVDVGWSVLPGAGANRVEIVWRESGGPPVRQPTHRGFGSQLLERGLPAGGKVEREFLPAGLVCRITLPLGPVGGEPGR